LQTNRISRAFLVFRKVGSISEQTYFPVPIHNTVFSVIPSQTTKLIGFSPELIVFDPVKIKAKCVASMSNMLTETCIHTALASNLETD